jgi:enoyl-CoA hydratase/carnithine racemase
MRYETLLYQKASGVGMISLNRPAADNAINRRLAEELTDICADINRDEGVRAVIVTGVGDKAFSAGIDSKEIASVDSKEELKLLSVAAPVAGLTMPVIAAINGDALGLGLELALACDLRIAVETASFALTHVVSGTIPWDGATQRLPRVVGKIKAMEMLLTGKFIDAREAYRIGLITKVVPNEQLMPVAMEMAQAIALKAPFALKYAKEAIYKGLDLTLEQGLRLEADLYLLLHTTEDRTEGIRAFLGKRHPRFKGK